MTGIEMIEPRARSDDVDDGVEGTQFVEMDLTYVDAVDRSLGSAQCPERRQCEGSDPIR